MEPVIVISSHRVHPERFAETGEAARHFGQGSVVNSKGMAVLTSQLGQAPGAVPSVRLSARLCEWEQLHFERSRSRRSDRKSP
jgi:hypothetical protein